MHVSFAPGRVELLGNHTDYNEGVVLSAALDLGIQARGCVRPDGGIRLASKGQGEKSLPPGSTLERTGAWTDYPLGVVQELRAEGFPVDGFEAEFSSTLPSGAGLSSSAALEVATAVLLSRLFGFSLEPLALAKLCRRAENQFVGVNCGLLDQVSSVFGRRNEAVFLDCRSETVTTLPFPAHAGLVIVHSGVKHALTGGEYNERREQCFAAAKALGVRALRDATTAQLREAALPDLVRRRALHITGENERVWAAVEDLRTGDAEAFGRHMTASHQSSRDNFANSTPELDLLVEIACAQPGVYGARLTGGGFGGAIVALTDIDQIEQAAAAIESKYIRRTGHPGKAYRCTIGDGAAALSE